MQTRPRPATIVYPDSDGKPMAESDIHRKEMMRLIETLEDAFAADPSVYVSGNLLLYYEEGNPRRSVAPDVFVARGVVKLPLRRVYLLWEEGAPPALVIEVTSSSTRGEDLRRKKDLYAQLGVREYILYDPLGEWLKPSLQGHRLGRAGYEPIAMGIDGALQSDALGLRLRLEEGRLRLLDGRTGAPLLSPRERADAEAQARRRAEARSTELEALLAEHNPPPTA